MAKLALTFEKIIHASFLGMKLEHLLTRGGVIFESCPWSVLNGRGASGCHGCFGTSTTTTKERRHDAKASQNRGRRLSQQGFLMDIIRAGAHQLIVQALKAAVTELLATYADQRDEQGHARVVLSGHHPECDIQTGMWGL